MRFEGSFCKATGQNYLALEWGKMFRSTDSGLLELDLRLVGYIYPTGWANLPGSIIAHLNEEFVQEWIRRGVLEVTSVLV